MKTFNKIVLLSDSGTKADVLPGALANFGEKAKDNEDRFGKLLASR
jgi:hypothetical protein